MARDAAIGLEQAIAVPLLRRQRRRVAAQPAVESASRSQQRAFVGRDGIDEAELIGLMSVGVAELAFEIRVEAQLFQGFADARPHRCALERRFDMSLEVADVALPIEAEAERR